MVGRFPSLSETFILDQITGLIDLGHDVEIFAQEGNFEGKIHPDILNYKLKNRTHFFITSPQKFNRVLKATSLVIENFHKSPLKILKSLNIFRFGKKALSLSLLNALIYFLDGDFDIIYCHFGPIGNFGACLKQIGIKGRLVTAFHGADMRMEIKKGEKSYHTLFSIGDIFLVTSKYGSKNLIQFGADPKKIIFHPVGVDIRKFSRQLSSFDKENGSKIKIITVARLVEEKGLEHGIRAIKKIVSNNPKINLEYIIIGEGPLEHSLKKLVDDLNLSKTIHFLGSMTQEKVILQMSKAHVFLLPSVSESFGAVLLEAQAMSIPIVTTNIGGVPEAISDQKTGFLVPIENIKAMVLKIESLIKDKKLRLEMGKYGRKYVVRHYNIQDLNDRLNSVFKKLILGN